MQFVSKEDRLTTAAEDAVKSSLCLAVSPLGTEETLARGSKYTLPGALLSTHVPLVRISSTWFNLSTFSMLRGYCSQSSTETIYQAVG